jgi:hypothetical protein
VCSLAGGWAEEELAKRNTELANASATTTPDYLVAAKNASEKRAMVAGRKRGCVATGAFDKAWINAKQSL